jgi:hypothetical protein
MYVQHEQVNIVFANLMRVRFEILDKLEAGLEWDVYCKTILSMSVLPIVGCVIFDCRCHLVALPLWRMLDLEGIPSVSETPAMYGSGYTSSILLPGSMGC